MELSLSAEKIPLFKTLGGSVRFLLSNGVKCAYTRNIDDLTDNQVKLLLSASTCVKANGNIEDVLLLSQSMYEALSGKMFAPFYIMEHGTLQQIDYSRIISGKTFFVGSNNDCVVCVAKGNNYYLLPYNTKIEIQDQLLQTHFDSLCYYSELKNRNKDFVEKFSIARYNDSFFCDEKITSDIAKSFSDSLNSSTEMFDRAREQYISRLDYLITYIK